MSAYANSITELRDGVADWLKLLDDPFKAPELKVGFPSYIGSLAFETAVQYEVMMRGNV